MVVPSPFVYWAQTEGAISLKIDLKNVQKPNVNVVENKLKFSAQGIGAHGDTHYQFSLDLFCPVKTVSIFNEVLMCKCNTLQIVAKTYTCVLLRH